MNYEVGQFYKVPCVRGQWHHLTRDWPVMGVFHEDKTIIGFPNWHYHLDLRFVAPRFIVDQDVFGRPPLERAYAFPLQVNSHVNTGGLPAPILRRRKCQRGREGLPYTMPEYRSVSWMPKLEAAHATCNLTGLVCPHRGYDLSTEPVDADGVVTCPMHGLRWNVFTGALVPRFERPLVISEEKT